MKRINAALKWRCPNCYRGSLFPNESFFDFHFDVKKSCDICNEDFVREPGFYYGAMFLSYIISAFLFLFIAGFCILIIGLDYKMALAIVFLFFIISFSYLFRLSRSIWLHLLVKKK